MPATSCGLPTACSGRCSRPWRPAWSRSSSTHVGLGGTPGGDRPAELRKVAIEFAAEGVQTVPGALPQAVVECHNGECSSAVVRGNEVTGGYQVTFDVMPGGNPVELRCFLARDGKPISETWLYRLDNT